MSNAESYEMALDILSNGITIIYAAMGLNETQIQILDNLMIDDLTEFKKQFIFHLKDLK